MQTVQMFRQRFCRLCVAVCCSLVFSHCATSQEVNIKDDLEQYRQHHKSWQETENKISGAIAIVRRDQFVHDDLTINVLTPFIGLTQEYVGKLEEYQPKTLPVSNIHQQYVEGWRAQQFAIASAVDAAERKDYVQLAKATTNLRQAEQSVVNTVSNLNRLAEQAGLIERPAEPDPAAPAAPPAQETVGEVSVQ